LKKEQFHIRSHYFLTLLIAFCLPIARFTPIFIALLLLNWLVEGDFRNKFKSIGKNNVALLFIGFYVLHLIGLTYTQNRESGLFDIQVKFSLLVFPLVFATKPIAKPEMKNVFFAFIAGAIVSSFILLTRAIYTYVVNGENNFFYQEFSSYLIHPSYLSMYFNLAIAWLLIQVLNKSFIQTYSTAYSCLIILFFSFVIVLLSSKLGLIVLILQFIGFLVFFIISRKKYILGGAGLLLILISAYSVITFVPAIRDRVHNAVIAISATTDSEKDSESTAVRLLIWKAADQVISENFLWGTGTGDAKDALMKEYQKRGMTGALEHKLNSHNEYYQVFLSLGLIGFLLLIASLLLPLKEAFNTSNHIYILFLVIIILNFIPESMFETQAGVMFYAFFNSLLCFSDSNYLTTQKSQ
jgi:O-antigen ligase